jgi:hypothetical protein
LHQSGTTIAYPQFWLTRRLFRPIHTGLDRVAD